jgi:hypothetical protein
VLDEHNRPARPWSTIILDDYSRAVAGYALSLHAPSSAQTEEATRRAAFDLQWKVALGIELDVRPFAKSTLQEVSSAAECARTDTRRLAALRHASIAGTVSWRGPLVHAIGGLCLGGFHLPAGFATGVLQ